MSNKDQLSIPETVYKDAASFEILRVWIANKGQHLSLRVGVWEDPAAWGIMIADLARHVVKAHFPVDEISRQRALQRIIGSFNVELASTSKDKTE